MSFRLRGGGPGSGGRGGAAARRRKTVRRATPRLSPVRAVAALVMLVSVGLGYWVTTSSSFAFAQMRLTVSGNDPAITSEDQVRSALGLTSAAPNLFLVATDRLGATIAGLPGVSAATVTAELPGTLDVHIVEREPILMWQTAAHRFLVDRQGLLVADAGAPGSAASGAPAALIAKLPIIDDRRGQSAGLVVGGKLDPIDLDVATRLGSLTPADLGSAAPALAISVDDTVGYAIVPATASGVRLGGDPDVGLTPPVAIPTGPGTGPTASTSVPGGSPDVTSSINPTITPSATPRPGSTARSTPKPGASATSVNPYGWSAVFGFYTPTIRPPDLIQGQVRLLRSLLSGKEARIGRVILADDRNGTYLPR